MFVRSKVVKDETYYQLVEGYRDPEGKVRHRTVASLGTSPTVAYAIDVAKERLTQLKRKRSRLARFRNPMPLMVRQLAALDSQMDAIGRKLETLSRIAASVDTTEVIDPTDAIVMEYAVRAERIAQIMHVDIMRVFPVLVLIDDCPDLVERIRAGELTIDEAVKLAITRGEAAA